MMSVYSTVYLLSLSSIILILMHDFSSLRKSVLFRHQVLYPTNDIDHVIFVAWQSVFRKEMQCVISFHETLAVLFDLRCVHSDSPLCKLGVVDFRGLIAITILIHHLFSTFWDKLLHFIFLHKKWSQVSAMF